MIFGLKNRGGIIVRYEVSQLMGVEQWIPRLVVPGVRCRMRCYNVSITLSSLANCYAMQITCCPQLCSFATVFQLHTTAASLQLWHKFVAPSARYCLCSKAARKWLLWQHVSQLAMRGSCFCAGCYLASAVHTNTGSL